MTAPDATENTPAIVFSVRLTEFQREEVGWGLHIDESDGFDPFGIIRRTGKTTAWLDVHNLDRAIWRVTSARDICADNAAMSDGSERLALSAQARSLQSLTNKLVAAAGGAENLSDDTRHFL